MVRHSNTWVFNISPDNWDLCAQGPSDPEIHGEEHVDNPWHGVRGSPDTEPDLESGDLVLARLTSADGTNPNYGVKGIWEFVEARPIDSQDEVPWEDAEYGWAIYCRPLHREFDQVYTEDFQGSLSFHSMTLQGAIKSLEPSHKEEYLTELLGRVDLNNEARTRLQTESSVEVRTDGSTPSVWIEKTYYEDREYKQSGDYALGKAIYSPSASEDGRDIHSTMREADVSDLVFHLLQENGSIVGVSRIESELDAEFEGLPEFDWNERQQDAGGYLRWLTDYQGLDEPVAIYSDVLDVDAYEPVLHELRGEYTHLPYDKNLELSQGQYLCRCPPELTSLIAGQNEAIEEYLRSADVPIVDVEPPGDGGLEFDSIDEATDEILARLEQSEHDNILKQELTDETVEEWWEALKGFQPGGFASPETEKRLLELEETLERLRPQFETIADELRIPGLNHLDPAEVCFLACLRERQLDIGIDPNDVNANQPKLNTIQRRAYDSFDNPTHPLVEQVRSNDLTVYGCTAPVDYWLAVLRHRLFGVEETHASRWETMEEGDILLFHAGGEPMEPGLPHHPGSIFGAAIIGKTWKEPENPFRTYDYHESGRTYPNLVSFDRLFVTHGAAILGDPPAATADTDEKSEAIDTLLDGAISITQINEICLDAVDEQFPAQGAIKQLNDSTKFGRREAILDNLSGHIDEIEPITIFRDFHGTVSESAFEDLYFPDEFGVASAGDLARQITAALRSGKHIIFTGPPGTGKTVVAERVVEHLSDAYPHLYSGHELTTATADWSTFNTVGGYMPSPDTEGDQLDFHSGVLLNRFKHPRSKSQANEPTVIDEINRADIDKAFGQLFTTLSGQSVTVPYRLKEEPDKEIEITTHERIDYPPSPSQFVVPRSWRLLGTMNTFDKTSLHELSYAFMRRFTFIWIGVPTVPEEDRTQEQLLQKYTAPEVWDIDAEPIVLRNVAAVWRATNTAVEQRSIGPAIIRDILSYVAAHERSGELESRLTEAVVSYIFPQLEGVPERDEIATNIAQNTAVDYDDLERAAQDMLGVTSLNFDSETN
ncbi:AAA family ATPase [Natrononativus amylolyticus]|uniref:AAA family ATPase n=1 Tax=Natrononativus amylolyticus TaxID=2963434 RepID=UPI0020CCAB3F|nr:AAA family ATPase [Natrononativus amylolyticus]